MLLQHVAAVEHSKDITEPVKQVLKKKKEKSGVKDLLHSEQRAAKSTKYNPIYS